MKSLGERAFKSLRRDDRRYAAVTVSRVGSPKIAADWWLVERSELALRAGTAGSVFTDGGWQVAGRDPSLLQSLPLPGVEPMSFKNQFLAQILSDSWIPSLRYSMFFPPSHRVCTWLENL